MLPFLAGKDKLPAKGDWWAEAFTLDECAAIEDAFQPLGFGNISAESQGRSTNPNTIGILVGHLKKENVRHLGYKLLERADTLINANIPILDLHFYLSARGNFFYRWRELDPFAFQESIESFQRQIGMASNAVMVFRESPTWGFIPAHAGYRQLRIIEEKRGNLTLARALCEQAKSEGWADDWDHQIARIDKKLAKGG
jgi:hypothetical protein